MTWRLTTVTTDGKPSHVEHFDSAGSAANWIARVEEYQAGGCFFKVLLGAGFETDDEALSFLNHRPRHGRHSYVLKRVIQ